MDFAREKALLHRTPWGEFPDVVLHADEPLVKRHSQYQAAKEGNAVAAEALVSEAISDAAVARIALLGASSKPYLLAVHAFEAAGMNAIPRVFARALSKILDMPVASGVVQINRVSHTGASGYHRLVFPALFDGEVRPVSYLLVDDFIGQGGTLANLKGFVERHGGRVVGATSLTGKAYSAKLRLERSTLQELREKHGAELEEYWTATFGYSLERLTESEARYLGRADDVDTIRDRLAAARRA